ncbi:unnamed protein product, partial [Prorocentrum cordatum]
MTALRPRMADQPGWKELEERFVQGTLRPMAAFLAQANSSEGYSQGLRTLGTYHAGALYTGWLLQELGMEYLGDGDDPRVARKVEDLLGFYLTPPEPKWLPDGYEDDDVQAAPCAARVGGGEEEGAALQPLHRAAPVRGARARGRARQDLAVRAHEAAPPLGPLLHPRGEVRGARRRVWRRGRDVADREAAGLQPQAPRRGHRLDAGRRG